MRHDEKPLCSCVYVKAQAWPGITTTCTSNPQRTSIKAHSIMMSSVARSGSGSSKKSKAWKTSKGGARGASESCSSLRTLFFVTRAVRIHRRPCVFDIFRRPTSTESTLRTRIILYGCYKGGTSEIRSIYNVCFRLKAKTPALQCLLTRLRSELG